MEVIVEKVTDYSLMADRCATTMGRTEASPDPYALYTAEHSPIRTQEFLVLMRGIPTFVSTHLVRHKFGVEHFVKSNREDRPGYTGDGGRNHPVDHDMHINAQALISMARKRFCYHAHEETRQVMRLVHEGVRRCDEALARAMKPDCLYRGYVCHELRCCGKVPGVVWHKTLSEGTLDWEWEG